MSLLKKKKDTEHKASHDRYLITYADLITLLLGLFVILYATASVDNGKYSEMSKAMSEVFKSNKSEVLQGSGGVLPGPKDGIPEPIMQNPARKSMQDIKNEADKSLAKFITEGKLQMVQTSDGLKLTLPERLLFLSGKADIQQEALQVLDSLAVVFNVNNFLITVDGHTDSDPINSFRFASNWHLSTGRALSIGYYLINKGMNETNVVIRGFGAQRPVADNMTPENKAKNRRVEMTISQLPTNALSTEGYQKDTLKTK